MANDKKDVQTKENTAVKPAPRKEDAPVSSPNAGTVEVKRGRDEVTENAENEVVLVPGETVNLVTTAEVEFTINGEHYKGTQFDVEPGALEDRKAMLRSAYGKDIIKD